MGTFYKVRLCMSKVSVFVLVLIILIEICHTQTDKQSETQDTNKHNRRRRQAGDIILMGYKAQKALKGTTRPSEFFNRIGKKWIGAPGLNSRDIFIRPDGYGDGVYIDDDYVGDW